jgi:CO/xanthine dehydrogenase FAD-binding subunit
MGSPQIRNRATIGGNIINGGAAADMTPVIISLDGLLVLESLSGVRTISCENYFKTNEKIRDTEVLTKIILPKKNQLTGFYKLGKRNALAIARLSLAMGLELDGTTIKSISICLGAVGKFPFRVKDFEEAAINQPVEWLSSERPLQILEEAVFQSIQGRKTMPFKKEAIKGVYKEALKRTLSRNGVGV